MSEAYIMTDAWITEMSEEREQSSRRKYGDYTEDDSVDDVYLEDISSYSKLLHEDCLLPYIFPSFISIRE